MAFVSSGALHRVMSHATAGVVLTGVSHSSSASVSYSAAAADTLRDSSAWTKPAANGAAGKRAHAEALHFFTATSSSLSSLSDRQVASLMGCLAERIEELAERTTSSSRTVADAADKLKELRLWFEVFLHSFLHVHHCRMAYQQDKLLVLQAIARAGIPLNDRVMGYLRKADVTIEVLESSDFLASTPLEGLAKVALMLSREEKWDQMQLMASRCVVFVFRTFGHMVALSVLQNYHS